jgi:hypothetical protein
MRTFQYQNYQVMGLPQFQNGDTFLDCHFEQAAPHTAIGGAATGLVFTRCNLTNCDVPADTTLTSCLHIHVQIVTVQTVAVADYQSYLSDMAAAAKSAISSLQTMTINSAIAPTAVTQVGSALSAIQAKQDALITAAQATVIATRTTAGKWVPPATGSPQLIYVNGVLTSVVYTQEQVVN